MKIFGIEITLDFRPPLVTDEQVQAVAEEWEQAKEQGDSKTRWQAGNRLHDQGYCWDGKQWYLPGEEEESGQAT